MIYIRKVNVMIRVPVTVIVITMFAPLAPILGQFRQPDTLTARVPTTQPADAEVYRQTLPDIDDLSQPNILDLETGHLGHTKKDRFDSVADAFKAWQDFGDLIWDNAEGGQWGILARQATLILAAEVAALADKDLTDRVAKQDTISSAKMPEGSLLLLRTRDTGFALVKKLRQEPRQITVAWIYNSKRPVFTAAAIKSLQNTSLPPQAAPTQTAPSQTAPKPDKPVNPVAQAARDRLSQKLYEIAYSNKQNANVPKAIQQIRALIEQGADLSWHDSKLGNTPLHAAADSGAPDIVAVLLDLGAKIDELSKGGATPLHLAAAAGRPDVCELLLKRGADPSRTLPDGTTILQLVRKDAPARDDLLRLLKTHGAKVTTLLAAVELGNAPAIERLAVNKEVANQLNRDGLSLLHIAARNGHTAACKALLAAGADPNRGGSKDGKDLPTPLIGAVQNGHKEIVAILLQNGAGGTPRQQADALLNAVLNDSAEICQLLLDAKAPTNVATVLGLNALEAAWQNGSASVVDVFSRQTRQEPPLWTVARLGRLEAVRKLLAQKADVDARSPQEGLASLHYALAHKHIQVAQALLDSGAKPDEPTANNQKLRPLHIAVVNADADAVTLLLDKGAAIDATDALGQTAIFHAVCLDKLEIAKLLLKRGADPKLSKRMDEQIRSLDMAKLLEPYGVTTKRPLPPSPK